MQCYADWCVQNLDIWENRSEELKEQRETAMVQPVVEDAAYDARFATLFPLSLPTSLVESRSLEPGPPTQREESHSSLPNGGSRLLPDDAAPHSPRKTRRVGESSGKLPDSPSAKAMRAVYHTSLLDQRYRVSSWTRGVPIPGVTPLSALIPPRRSSTPGLIHSSTTTSAGVAA